MKLTYASSVLLSLTIVITSPLVLLTSSFSIGISKAIALTTKPPYNFKKPPNRGAPGTATTGGSRDDCKVKNPILRSIAPIAEDKTVGGVTASAQPEFWFSTTFNEDCATLEFVLKSDRGLTLYRGPVKMPIDPKPFAVQLPANVTLKAGKSYHWYLLAKGKNQPPISVDGFVERVEGEEPKETGLLKAKLYAEQGLWHEAASLVQAILTQTPDDPAAQAFWNAIVTDAGIGDLTKPEPLQP
jgi:Domain of Unknown Function (DUF928)